jgi:iron complex transport system ATP-binding protein
MDKNGAEILILDNLSIGYTDSKHSTKLLPPLSTSSTGSELIAVIGRNGIGKSTLLRTIAGLQPSLGGEVILNGKSISEYSRLVLARRIGYISTEVVKVSNMRVSDLVALGRFPHTNWLGTIDQSGRLAIENAIARTGLTTLRTRNISELSDGERQKTMIARVLAQDAELMIMDEPTAFLDIASKYEIISLMRELTRDGKTIIFSTHDFNIAVNQADKIWLILENNLIEGAPEDLMLSGAFEHLFQSSIVQFSSGDGSFSFLNESRGSLYVRGEGLIRKWTEKALKREGYQVSSSMTNPYIQVPDSTDQKWLLTRDDQTAGFSSIYELIRVLQK